jgi:hypothetical protein
MGFVSKQSRSFDLAALSRCGNTSKTSPRTAENPNLLEPRNNLGRKRSAKFRKKIIIKKAEKKKQDEATCPVIFSSLSYLRPQQQWKYTCRWCSYSIFCTASLVCSKASAPRPTPAGPDTLGKAQPGFSCPAGASVETCDCQPQAGTSASIFQTKAVQLLQHRVARFPRNRRFVPCTQSKGSSNETHTGPRQDAAFTSAQPPNILKSRLRIEH